ncbi:hypothetical protein HPP92_017986 [Vanilla planifolia]|uniref:Uncharacterized protein n=1 Tax=Vanilla planifolia TaxID=51239 RepID=A0A835QC45_VANPL|nr:hypothetical protein HPP92_017986 [Vanilla planifolia]
MAPEFASDLMQICRSACVVLPVCHRMIMEIQLSPVPSIDEAVVALDPSAPITSVAGDAMDAFRGESTRRSASFAGESSAGRVSRCQCASTPPPLTVICSNPLTLMGRVLGWLAEVAVSTGDMETGLVMVEAEMELEPKVWE